MIYVTSDHHFDHKNILRYCHRDFANVSAMNHELIQAWNETVREHDTVYYLGDFAFCDTERAKELFAVLNGNIIVLRYPFHHDRYWLPKDGEKFLPNVTFRGQMVSLKIYNTYVTLCHFPLEIWDRKHYGAYHCHGHSHGKLDAQRTERILDVGVDNAFRITGKYRPFSLWEALSIVDQRIEQ